MLEYYVLFSVACWIAIIDLVWFDSSAFEEYCELLGADKFFKVAAFKEEQKSDFALTYHNYLLLKHDGFFTRLITCQLCTTIWLSILACVHIGFAYFPFLTILSYAIYGGVIKINERH